MTRSLDLRFVPGALLAFSAAFWLTQDGQATATVVSICAGLGALGASWALRGNRAWAGQTVFGLLVVSLMAGAVAAHLTTSSSALIEEAVHDEAQVTVHATLTADPKPVAGFGSGTRVRVHLRTSAVVRNGSGAAQLARVPLIVFAGARWANLSYGTRVEALGRVKAVADPVAKERFRLIPAAEPVSVSAPGGILAWTAHTRAGLVRRAEAMPEHARGLVPGIGVGDRTQMSPELAEAMRITGLTHVTAVSGSHFAIVAATVLGLTTLLRIPPRVRVVVTGGAMALFVLLVRPEPSVARAGVMGAFALAGMGLGRPARALTGLATCVIGLLLADPWLARSYGFILSVTATGALVLGAGPLTRVLMRWVPQWLALMIAVPTVAQAACGPIVILLEPRLATYAVPANLLAIPALGPATICAVLAAVVSPLWPAAASGLATIASWAASWIGGVAVAFAGLPGSYPPWPSGVRGALLLALGTAALVLAITLFRSFLNRFLYRRRAGRAPWLRTESRPGAEAWDS